MTQRYAVYFAPPSATPWWTFGAGWLGRDERSDAPMEQPRLPQIAADRFRRITQEPRRYGFHATLKAPFRLYPGIDEAMLLQRMELLAAILVPVPLGTLVPVQLDGFVALVPASPSPELAALAEACVTSLDDLRAPLSQAELARRTGPSMDRRGRELLERFGYPLVLERFRFHMTLTGPVEAAVAGELVAHLTRQLPQLHAQAVPVLDRLCLFVEGEPGAPFRRRADVMLGV